MSAMRGVVLIAYGLGFAALALGAWHLMRRPDAPRR